MGDRLNRTDRIVIIKESGNECMEAQYNELHYTVLYETLKFFVKSFKNLFKSPWVLQGRSQSSGKYPRIPRLPAYGPGYLACMLSYFSRVQLFVTLWTVASQASLSMGFSWQEHQSGLICPPLGDLPVSVIKPMSPALQVDLPLSHRQAPRLFWLLPILWARFSSLPEEAMNFQYPTVHFVFCLISCSLKPWTLMVTPSKLKFWKTFRVPHLVSATC